MDRLYCVVAYEQPPESESKDFTYDLYEPWRTFFDHQTAAIYVEARGRVRLSPGFGVVHRYWVYTCLRVVGTCNSVAPVVEQPKLATNTHNPSTPLSSRSQHHCLDIYLSYSAHRISHNVIRTRNSVCSIFRGTVASTFA
jgi:hypothetical protein